MMRTMETFVRQQRLDESVYLDQEAVRLFVYNEGTETYWPMNGGKRLTSRYEYLKSGCERYPPHGSGA